MKNQRRSRWRLLIIGGLPVVEAKRLGKLIASKHVIPRQDPPWPPEPKFDEVLFDRIIEEFSTYIRVSDSRRQARLNRLHKASSRGPRPRQPRRLSVTPVARPEASNTAIEIP